MKTNRKKMNLIKVGLLGIVLFFSASMASAALIHLDPQVVQVDPGDAFIIEVKGNDFGFSGVTGGSITMNWDPGVLSLNTTKTNAQIDALIGSGPGFPATGFTDVPLFDTSTLGQLDFTALVGISDDPQGVGDVNNPNGTEFTFLRLNFSALAPPGTDLLVGLGPDGNWQLGDFTEVVLAPEDYTGTTITVVNPVPVPGAVWLLGSGLLGLVGVVRRRSA